VVLDEPNSNLDGEGEAALTEAIRAIRDRGGIVVIIAHRPSALVAVDLVAAVQNGRLTAFGPKDEIIRARVAPSQPPANAVDTRASPSEPAGKQETAPRLKGVRK